MCFICMHPELPLNHIKHSNSLLKVTVIINCSLISISFVVGFTAEYNPTLTWNDFSGQTSNIKSDKTCLVAGTNLCHVIG